MRVAHTVWLSFFGLWFFPLWAQAHTEGITSSWATGFSHPLEGWDHLITMVVVGIWAAQLQGKAVWQMPLAFVGVMTLGALIGMGSLTFLGAERMIVLSVAVLTMLVLSRIQLPTIASISLVMFFAFFHGYAHGQEMPASAGLLSFALGFVSATLLLHGTGILLTRFFVVTFVSSFGTSVYAQQVSDKVIKMADEDTETPQLHRLQNIIITERADSQIGVADSASQGNIGQEQLRYRPITRPGEILETVPGLIATQHSGEGKSNQFFLRGFNLDHGTDFLTKIDGVPVNLVSHAHGQGWTDTNFLIPELIGTISYQKGNYYAENGDFSSAGAADIRYFDTLPDHIVKFTGGSFDYYRGLLAGSLRLSDGNLLYGGEIVNNDGPWDISNDYLKFNGVLRYSEEYEDSGWSATAMAFKSDWDATDQIPKRAFENGTIGRFGTIDPTDGGSSRRYSLTGEWHRQDDDSASKLTLYGIYHELDLYSNFTFFLDHPERGDQFAQPDRRWTSGLNASHTWFHKIGSFDSDSTVGLQVRNDSIRNGLLLTQARQRWDTVRSDDVRVTSISPYFENKTRWTPWLRTQLGVRFDGFQFNVSDSNRNENDGTRNDGMISPKAGIVFGPWADTEFYLNGGLGFHSNDARGINQRVDPASGGAFDEEGNPVTGAVPLVRTYGAEVGMRATWIEGLQNTLSFWWLDIDSELLFVGDAGTTEASRPSRRYGVEWANYYSPTDWLTFDADFSFSKARFRANDPAGNHIPGAIESMIAAGATVHDIYGGFFGGPRLRYFGPRPLIEDNSVRSDSTILLSALLGYRFDKTWSLKAEVFNILDRKDSAIDYYYESQLRGEADPVEDIHFHPVEPVSFRMSVTANF